MATKDSLNNSEFVRKITELLEWQKEQEEQVKLAEQFSLKLRKQLEKADIKEFQYKSVDELVTTDYSNEDIETGEFNDSDKINQNKEFNERLLSDIVEESFEQGLSNDAVQQSKFSTPKETTANQLNLDNKDQNDETAGYNSLNKQYTKHCTEECTKQDCAHTIRFSESYERILKIISNYNSKLNKSNEDDNSTIEDEDSKEENDEELDDEEAINDFDELEDELTKKEEKDFKNEFKKIYSSTNENIYELNEYFKEELSKSLDPNLNNEQYTYRSLSETNLNYSLDYLTNKAQNLSTKKDLKQQNRTFSSDAINNQIKSIEKDLAIEDVENCPVKGGVDGRNVKTFDELLNQKLSNDYSNLTSSIYFRDENSTKRPYLKKGDGLKRFQSRSTSEPRGKLCRIRNQQKLKQQFKQQQTDDRKVLKKRIDNKKVPDLRRIDYLAQPKSVINRELGELVDKENELKLNQSNNQSDIINRDYVTSNLSDKLNDKKSKSKIITINKEVKESSIKNKKQPTASEQVNKKAKVQLVSKISVNKSFQDHQEKRTANDLVQKEWNKKETVEDSNKRLEVLLEKFIELYESKNKTKADEETRRNIINMLKNSLRLDGDSVEQTKQCKECGKHLESEESELSSFGCNPIEADQTSYFSDDPDTFLVTPKIGAQTLALRNKIENLQKRLVSLQTRCDQDERKLDKKGRSSNCQSFTNKNESNKECTCSGQMEILKDKLNFITNKLHAIEKNALHSPTGRVINHPIAVDEPNKDTKTNNPKISKISKSNMQNSDTKLLSRTKTEHYERKTINNQRASPNDVVIERSKDGDNRVTKYKSGLTIVEKLDGTVEKHYSNGYQEIFFSDGTIMRILVDGTKIIDFQNGEREIRTNNYKRREFIDGSVKTTYSDGTKETRYMNGRLRVKDKYGTILVDSKLPNMMNR